MGNCLNIMIKQLCIIILLGFVSFDCYSYDEYFVIVKEPLAVNSLGALSNGPKKGLSSKHIKNIKLFKDKKNHGLNSLQVNLSDSNSNSTDAMKMVRDNWTYMVSIDAEGESEFLQEIQSLDQLVHVQPNYRYKAFNAVNERYYSTDQQTAFELMNFDEVWEISTGNGVIVAVLDTGIRYKSASPVNHNEFNSFEKIVAPMDFVTGVSLSSYEYEINGEDYQGVDDEPDDYHGHGTHVAGIIGAEYDGTGIVGAAYGVQIMPIRVLYAYAVVSNNALVMESSGTTAFLVNGINYAVTNNAHIINMSLGGDVGRSNDVILQSAIDSATVSGVLVVAAAGNSKIDIDEYFIAPAYYDNTMAVSAVTEDGVFESRYSNFGGSIDVAAVGTNVLSSHVYDSSGAFSSGGYEYLTGTSMAAPFVSALAAIIKSYNSDLTPEEIRRLIQRSASRSSSGHSTTMGHGIIDAKQALFLAGESTFSVTSTSESVLMGANGLFSDLLCYPNPLVLSQDSFTTCTYYLNQMATVDAWIYSRRGQLLKRSTVTQSVGKQVLIWSGTDMSSNAIPNGVYQLVVSATAMNGDDSGTKKHLITVYR